MSRGKLNVTATVPLHTQRQYQPQFQHQFQFHPRGPSTSVSSLWAVSSGLARRTSAEYKTPRRPTNPPARAHTSHLDQGRCMAGVEPATWAPYIVLSTCSVFMGWPPAGSHQCPGLGRIWCRPPLAGAQKAEWVRPGSPSAHLTNVPSQSGEE